MSRIPANHSSLWTFRRVWMASVHRLSISISRLSCRRYRFILARGRIKRFRSNGRFTMSISSGAVKHQEFLADADSDPRRPFAETLIAALRGNDLPIIVYSSYERTRLKALAALFPDFAEPIGSIVQRLADLLPIVRSGVYHPKFDFSNAIKAAAPALCPDVTYDDLEEIADGTAASTAFWLMASGRADAETSARLRRSLRAYCQRDTWAMVRMHEALGALAAHSDNHPASPADAQI